jgi:protein translocase SecG subunit
MSTALQTFIIVLSISLSGLILIQAQGTGFGSTWGGGGETYHTKRGVEKVVMWATIAVVCIFVVAIIALHALT